MVSEGDHITANAAFLEAELDWLATLINRRFTAYFTPEEFAPGEVLFEPPPIDVHTPFTQMLRYYEFSLIERVALCLALAPLLRPQLLDVFYTRNSLFNRPFTEFGGRSTDGSFIPTGETLAFIVGGTSIEPRLRLRKLFSPEHVLRAHQILAPSPADLRDPLKTPLTLSEEICALILLGEPRAPHFGADFPAQHIKATLTWDDLVLHPGTRRQLEEVLAWMKHGDTLLGEWGMAGRIRPGLRCLFYGPPGTGKSMTAGLLGAVSGRDVYKIDLSLVVSKFIGETEKNLGRVFEQAENKNWILFFDEADALFGKRSETRDAHDRYANQETAFLLQRLETFNGVAVLASNLRDNIDAAFARRFESVIFFPVPRPEERRVLWERGFPKAATLEQGLDLTTIAHQHALTGGSIMNVVRYASLEALRRNEQKIRAEDVRAGIRRELSKERKAV